MASPEIETPLSSGTTDNPSAPQSGDVASEGARNEASAIAAGYPVQHTLPKGYTEEPIQDTPTAPSVLPQGFTEEPITPPSRTGATSAAAPSTDPNAASRFASDFMNTPAAEAGYNTSYGTATRQALDNLAKDTIGAIKSAVTSLNPKPQDEHETEALKSAGIGGMLIYRMIAGLGHPLMDSRHIAAAVHDINQSKDPMGTYLEIARDTASQGGGQAIAALGMESTGKAAGAARAGIRSRVQPTITETPAGAQIPTRPETGIGKAAWAGAPEEAAKLAQKATSPAIEKAIGGTIGEATGSEGATTLAPEDRMGLRGHSANLIEQAKDGYQYIDEQSGNKLSDAQEKIDNARGDFSKEGREAFKAAKADKQALLDQYREGAKEQGIDVDAADAAYRKGIAVKKMAAKLDTATGASTVEGAEHQLNGTRLAKVIDDGVKKGSWKEMGLTDDHIAELQKLGDIAKEQMTIPKSGKFMSGLGKAAIFAAGIHGGLFSAIEAATGVSGAEWIGGQVARHVVQDAVMNQEATMALADNIKNGGSGQSVVDSLAKNPSWVDQIKKYAQDKYDQYKASKLGSETGAVGAKVTQRRVGTQKVVTENPDWHYRVRDTQDEAEGTGIPAAHPESHGQVSNVAHPEWADPETGRGMIEDKLHPNNRGVGPGINRPQQQTRVDMNAIRRDGIPHTQNSTVKTPEGVTPETRYDFPKGLPEKYVHVIPEPKGGLGADADVAVKSHNENGGSTIHPRK